MSRLLKKRYSAKLRKKRKPLGWYAIYGWGIISDGFVIVGENE